MANLVIALDPKYADVYSLLGSTHFLDAIFSWSPFPGQSMGRAMKLAQKAIAMNDSLSGPHSLLGLIYTFTRQYEKAIAECERAIVLGPNDESAHRDFGMALRYAGKWKEAVPVYEKAIRLNPFPPSSLFWHLALTFAYVAPGRDEEARATAKEVLRIDPKFSVDHFSKRTLTYKNPADTERFASALRKAGLK